ncbi:ABC transporter membrane-spanning protein [Pseudonocardia yuanmonensis]|uniref:ABC transporter membrane-spanning protein n=1 Tax=Pseudonocardia yuanmonensis TaxID=1095914 RepID=A0ABP8W0U8_9PSEU
MSTLAPRATRGPAARRLDARPGRAVAGLAARSVRRGATVLVVAAAAMSAVVAFTYESVVGGAPGGAASLAVLAQNPAIRTLFGEPVALDTAGGFTVWRTGAALGVLTGMWALLAATRLLRGEEDSGRWALLVAGTLPAERATARVLAVVTAVPVLAGAGVALALVTAGTPVRGAVLHGAGLALTGIFFGGLGAIAAQVAGRRAAATGAATAVLAAGLLARMIGDGVPALGWLRWLSPFGLTAQVAPFHADRVGPMVVLAVAALLVLAVTPALAGRRDVGEGLVRPAGARRPRRGLLGSPEAFAMRTVLAPWAGWCTGVGAYYLLVGLLTVSLTGFLTANAAFADLAAGAGFAGLDTARGYAATLFALLAMPVGGFAAVRIGALAADEAARRLPLLLAGPLTRTRLLLGHGAVTAVAAVLLSGAAGLAFWAGAALVDAPLGPGEAVAGALNTVPVSLLGLGAAVLALGWSPRLVVAAGSIPGVGGFLWLVISQSIDAPRWVTTVSPFAHLAAVPAAPAAVTATTVMLLVAACLAGLGVVGYRRRDLRPA